MLNLTPGAESSHLAGGIAGDGGKMARLAGDSGASCAVLTHKKGLGVLMCIIPSEEGMSAPVPA